MNYALGLLNHLAENYFISLKSVLYFQDIEIRVLDPDFINLIMMMRREYLAVPFERDNRSMRHGAYTAFILRNHGRLGMGQRRVIPSCVVWRIRDRYPEATGQYTGFMPARLA